MKLLLSYIALLLVPICTLGQQPGANDITFNTSDGPAFGDGTGFNDIVKATCIQPDGKIIVGGWFDEYNGVGRNFIARLNPDGSNDATFNIGTGFMGYSYEYVKAITLQADGKILVGGSFEGFNGINRNRIVRLNANGTIDATFNPGTGFNDAVSAIAVQTDGKIIVGGAFTQFNGTTMNRIARLNPNGTLDATFAIGTGFNGVNTISIQTDGKIVVGGFFTQYNGTTMNRIARLNTNGSLDPGFNIGTGFDYTVNCTAIQPDGKIIVGGWFDEFNGVTTENIARLNSNGSLDATFNTGTGFSADVNSVAIQSDGKIVVGGQFSQFNGLPTGRIARLNTNGSADLTFNSGTGFNGRVDCIAIQTDGKIISGGDFTLNNEHSRNRIARLKTDGSLDPTFFNALGASDQVVTMAIQPDGKIVIGGNFTAFNGELINHIARLHPDGTLDTTFHVGTGFNTQVNTIEIQPDGKLIMGGGLSLFNGTPINEIVRLNPDGTLDNTFNTTGTGPNSYIGTTAIQPDGKIIVGGPFTSFSSTSKNRIARLNANGTLDASFNPGIGFDNQVYDVKLQPDGKIMAVGIFNQFRGVSRESIARINPNGTLDTTFDVGYVDESISSLAIQPDGKIIVVGGFTFYQGNRNSITRVNPDGSNDPTFNIGTGFNHGVNNIVLQPDGKIIVGGYFTAYNGTPINRIARLNTDGSLDLTFNPAPGFNDWVFTTALQSDGKLLVGGKFTPLNAIPRNRIARLLTVCTLASTGTTITNVSCFGGSNGAIDFTAGGGTLPYTFDWGSGITTEDRTGLAPGTYSVTVSDAAGCITIFNHTVTQPNLLSTSTSLTNVSCMGSANGTINLIPVGGTAPYTFNWNDGATTEDRTGLDVGTYSVIITDAKGCSASASATITQPVSALSATTSITHITCSGGATGAIDLIPTGGTAPYSFVWNDGVTAEDRTGLVTGTYSVTVSDTNACSTIITATVTQAVSPITAASDVMNVSCFGGSNGEIDLTPTGGTLPYNFDWGNGITSEDRTGLSAGTYSVTVTDANGCAVINIPVSQPVSALSGIASTTPVSCFDGSNGTIDLTPAGGTAPYSFDWGSGVTTEDRTGLSAGAYPVTITDTNGCTTTVTPIVNQAAPITSSFVVTTCYVYTWNAVDYTTSGSYTQLFTAANGCDSTVTLNLTIHNSTIGTLNQTACSSYTLNGQTYTTSGTYMQILTNTAGCDSTLYLNLTILQPTVSSLTETACDAFTLNGQTYTASGIYIQHLMNAAGCDSALTLNLIITHSTTNSITSTNCYSYTLNGQTYTTSGTYTQHLTNSAGCDSVLTLNLTINQATTSSLTQNACNSFTLNGQTYTATGTYTQNFLNGNGCDSTLTLNLTINHPTTSSISQTACNSYTLNGQTYTSSGTYVQNLTNAAGCDSTLTLSLTINQPPTMTAVDNGNASITASQANSYQWINCSTGNAIAGATSQTFTASTNGTYAVIGTSTGCSDTSNCVTIDNLGIAEQNSFDLTLAPNPTADLVAVQFEGTDAKLTIRDAQGKLLVHQDIISGEQISLRTYADGVYIFEFNTAKGFTTRRVVKN